MSLPPAVFWEAANGASLSEVVARRVGLAVPDESAGSGGPAARAVRLGLERHGVRVRYDTLPSLVRSAGPALLTCFQRSGPPKVVAVLGPAGALDRVRLLDRDGRVRRVPASAVIAAMRDAIEHSQAGPVEQLLDAAGLRGRRRAAARERLLTERLHGRPIGGGELIRAAPHARPSALVRDARVLRPLLLAAASRVTATVVGLLGWWLIGREALEGRIAPGWVAGWGLLLLTGLLLERLSAWGQGMAAIRAGAWTKAMLLRGAMRADPQTYRAGGVGGILARISESQAIEDLVLSGGLQGALAVLDIVAAAWVFSQVPGTAGRAMLLLLAVGVVAIAVASAWMYTAQVRWTGHRRGLTRLLVERMAGHRTRLAQAEPARIHDGEDDALAAYHASSVRLDRLRVRLASGLGGGWGALGFAAVAALFVFSPELASGTLAVALGGVLLAQGALASLSATLSGLAAAAISWQEIRPLFLAARTRPSVGDGALSAEPAQPGDVLLSARQLRFAWPDRAPVLDDLSLSLRAGEQVLLTGPSGGGKSTLASLLTGAMVPQRGLLMLRGLDHSSLGEARWRSRAVCAPQFHDNHIFENTLSFNLLLGRSWPPDPRDVEEARVLLGELGLGPLLERMPAGMGQIVGESGWQLSHGERSRVFLARAILQRAELVVLDESFGALDPVTLRRCLAVTRARAPTLVVIAHP